MTKTLRKVTTANENWFRSAPDRTAPIKVDREAEVIYGYSVIRLGEAKGHGMEIDQTTLDQVLALGQSAKSGIKSRFTHPSLSGDGLGSYLGRSKNFRLDGDRIRADLHLAKSAHATPNGDLAKYTLDLAQEDPGAFGASIAFKGKREFRLEKDGTKKKGPDGKELPPVARIERLHASDIVDEPAANEGLFSTGELPDGPARQAHQFLDQLFGDAEPDVVRTRVGDFLQTYLSTKEPQQMSAQPTTGTPAPAPAPAPSPAPTAASAPVIDQAALSKAGEDATAAERKRCSEICALCTRANKPELALSAMKDGKSVEALQKDLLDAMLTSNKPVGEASDKDPLQSADPDAKFKAEYRANKDLYARNGVGEQAYVNSRRRDEGLPIEPKKAA